MRRIGGWVGSKPLEGFACQLGLLWMAGRRKRAPWLCLPSLSSCWIWGDIAEILFTWNRKNPVNIHLFNNPAYAHTVPFEALGSAFPFDVPSLSDSIWNLRRWNWWHFVFFHPFNPTSKLSNCSFPVQDVLLYWGRAVKLPSVSQFLYYWAVKEQ